MTSDPFAHSLRRLRKRRGLTQEQLAERSELSVDSIRRMERGTFSPTLNTLRKVAAGLALPLSALVEQEAEPPHPDTRAVPLDAFILESTDRILAEWEARMRQALVPEATPALELHDHIRVFLSETAETLRVQREGLEATLPPARSELAKEHSGHRLRSGFSIGAVVREYAMIRDCIVDLAEEADLDPSAEELERLGKCISAGTADAVTEFARQRDEAVKTRTFENLASRLDALRVPMHSARTALWQLRSKNLINPAGQGPLAQVVRGLSKLSALLDELLSALRTRTPIEPRMESLSLLELLTEAEVDSAAEAAEKELSLRVESDPGAKVMADRRLLRSAVANLVQNAVERSPEQGRVSVRARIADGLALIEVEDECGGLSPGAPELLLSPESAQLGQDESGTEAAVAKMAIEAHGGGLRLTDLPGRGCVYTLEFPARVIAHALEPAH